ncbi:hypothetical protein CQY20_31735 [Mycolicibacterium agri]|uniref:Uncharacterized protein n=1 Tax=Mycolicibacterium agri TaxID=36811 RepID=A0A2A7MNK2_MYCAG|nr:HAD domain-containing protein [Mycolicibacterium agri]PEG33266.1 hypothetical protein CQY20_31735 [Mycolicibacterium agri]GFG53464.1 hypothetical protein MAGR_49050 [Mycolicibacterium agri]
MVNTSRPLVALDIDGVLNPDPVEPCHPALVARLPGYVEHEITMPASDRHLPYLRGHGVDNITGRVLVNDAHAQWIRSLLGHGVEVSWATTWEHYANEVFGPLLGLPELPLAIEFHADVENGHYHPRMFGFGAAEWKGEALWHRHQGRPLVWIDDRASPLARIDVHGNPVDRGAPTLSIRCAGEVGLTRDEMQRVDDWLTRLRNNR